MRIAFRCDAAPTMGIGHLMRCLTLADALAARGCACCFLLADDSAAHAGRVEARGHSVKVLGLSNLSPDLGGSRPQVADRLPWGWRRDAHAALAAVEPDTAWIVVDHYGIDASWHEAFRARGQRLLAIDDMADRPLACDMLLDHNASAAEDLYALRLRKPARMLLGPRYALIRPAVEALRREPSDGPISRILVSFGGAAAGSVYRRFAETLASLPLRPLAITLIGVADADDRVAIEALGSGQVAFAAYGIVGDLVERSAAADLCIGAAGVSALERALVGAPTLTYVTADNQRLAIAALGRAGALVDMGDIADFSATALVDTILRLHYMPAARRSLAMNGQNLVPGGGPGRVADAIFSSGEGR